MWKWLLPKMTFGKKLLRKPFFLWVTQKKEGMHEGRRVSWCEFGFHRKLAESLNRGSKSQHILFRGSKKFKTFRYQCSLFFVRFTPHPPGWRRTGGSLGYPKNQLTIKQGVQTSVNNQTACQLLLIFSYKVFFRQNPDSQLYSRVCHLLASHSN